MAGIVNLPDSEYPELLRDTPNPPKALYYKGKFCRDIFCNCVAVVGSRRMSVYGRKVIEHLFSTLSNGITIVSGFMTGVDAEAHLQALRFGLRTIAVMPCGIDYIHPEDQAVLYNKILCSGGLVLSEHDGGFKPKIWTYPRRNRIVAGISKAVVIVEASINSGSLITAKIANSYGRKVFVVPGSIFSDLSAGKTQIGNEFAKGIDSGLCINEFLSLGAAKKFFDDNKKENDHSIVEILKSDPMTINELSESLKMNISDLSTELTLLSLKGLVSEQGGKFYAC